MVRSAWLRNVVILTISMAAIFLALGCSTRPKEPEEVYALRNQADGLLEQGNARMDALLYDAALDAYGEALDVYASIDDRSGTIRALLSLGRVWRSWGFPDEAADRYRLAESLARYSEDSRLMRSALNHRADLLIREDNPVEALALLEDPADDEGNPAPDPAAGRERAAQLRLRGTALHELGRDDEAMAALEAAVGVALDAGEDVEAAQVYYRMASITSLAGDYETAISHATLALERDKEAEYAPGIAADLRALGLIARKAGRDDLAEDYFRRSWLAWRGLGRNDEAERTRKDLEEVTGEPVREP